MNEKNISVKEILAKVSGLSSPVIDDIWLSVKENARKLDSCELPHAFVKTTENKLTPDYICGKCGGKVSAREARWYIRGLEDGRKA